MITKDSFICIFLLQIRKKSLKLNCFIQEVRREDMGIRYYDFWSNITNTDQTEPPCMIFHRKNIPSYFFRGTKDAIVTDEDDFKV